MKATVTVERTAVVTVDGVDLGRFEVKSSWEGFHKLVNASGEVLVLTESAKACGFDSVFRSIFGLEEERPDEYLVARASPSLIARMPKQASPTTPATAGEGLSRAALDVLAERRRQVEVEGWTPEHDDEHYDGSLARAAACYALGFTTFRASQASPDIVLWPWEANAWKPTDRRSMLVKAGALTFAEIERLDREGASHG